VQNIFYTLNESSGKTEREGDEEGERLIINVAISIQTKKRTNGII
jgi:hypothetical protein